MRSLSKAERVLTVLAMSVVALTLLLSSVAQAEPPRLIFYGNFGSGAPFSIGVAVDQSSSDVYVTSLFNPSTFSPEHVDEFDASGKLLSPPSPFGEGYDSNAAVNPTNGDVYVLETFGGAVINVYEPSSGKLLSSFPVEASDNFGPFSIVQIASDSAGNVYVPVVPANEILKYSAKGILLQTFTGSGAGALSEPTGVTVAASGDVWVADTGNSRIEELSPVGASIGEIKSEGVGSVALDTHGDVFAMVNNSTDFCGSLEPPCQHVIEYDSIGAQIADVGAGSLGGVGIQVPSMLAVNESSGRVYVTDPAKNLVWIFGPPTAPIVEKELAVEVGSSEAKLGALVNPGGLDASYSFEYGPTSAYGHTSPFPDGSLGQGITSRAVWASASSLAPGTTYHYRVVAVNELGTAYGADETFTTQSTGEVSCPNEQYRTGFSANLPDCRAYELVTPPSETSTQPDPHQGFSLLENHAAVDGGRMAYWAIDILPESSTGGENYLSTRGADGWSSEDIIPLQSYTGLSCTKISSHNTEADKIEAYSADLSEGVLHDNGGTIEEGCQAEPQDVVPGEPEGYENLLLRDNDTGFYQLLNAPPAGVEPANAHFQAASSDLSHVVFTEHAQLTSGAPGGDEDLYDWSAGTLRLVTVLPNGTPTAGSLAAPPTGSLLVGTGSFPTHVLSADGSHVFFTANGDLYARVNGESTVQLDASQAGGKGGGGHFVYASASGAKAFFTDDASAGLTGDTVPGSGTNLYEYDLEDGTLTDLTPVASPQLERVTGASEDGSHIYFAADGVLSGSQPNEHGETAQSGQRNLYLWDGGTATFIAALAHQGGFTTEERVSPNGKFLAFVSARSLTGYVNGFSTQIFLYNADSGRLECTSCNPTGEAATSSAALEPVYSAGNPHYLTDSGRLFFDTTESLLPSDTNGQQDVYEYENGELHLISTGTSSSESTILDMSESGNDVFFLTRQKLVPQDTDEEAHEIYDARVGGGFAAPSSPPSCTTADACRTPVSPQPAIYGAPSSQTFSGAGNLVARTPVAVKPKGLTRAQRLARAVRSCRKRYRHSEKRRVACERKARKTYGRAGKTARRAKSHKGGK